MAVLMAGREESLGGSCEVRDSYSGELMAPSNSGGIDDMSGLPILRVRPPSFQPMARPEVEVDPDAPVHPGATIWDFIDARGLDPNDPVVPAAHRLALEQYKRDMAAYRAAKAAEKAAAADDIPSDNTTDLIRS